MKFALFFTAAALVASPAAARVEASSEAGFAIVHEVDVAATPDALWAILIRPQRWWSGEHSWSGDVRNFSLDPRPGGCFCETLPLLLKPGTRPRHPDGTPPGFVEHARVIHAKPGNLLRLSGVLGPLQSEALTGTLSFTITPGANSSSSKLKVEYVVGGYSRIPLKSVAPAVDKVLGEQVMRLRDVAVIAS